MNNFKKIGLSALAGSLVAMSAATAGEMTISGGASVGVSQGKEENASAYYMGDSINFTFSGETDSGLTISQKIELEGGVDNQSTVIAGTFGTLTFHKHGGDSVMSGWDDKTPNAYDEPWGVVASDTNTTGTNEVHIINGISGDNMWRYDSPTVNGVSVHAAYKQTATGASESSGASIGSYTDFGVQIAPEMVEGLTIGYAFGEVEETASISNDESTLWITYAYGPLTVGYQTSEVDGQTSTQDDEGTAFGISYAVSDALSISYGVNDVDLGSETAAGTDQEAEGISASYTMGGVSISVAMNEVKNAGGQTAEDHEDAFDFFLVCPWKTKLLFIRVWQTFEATAL
jgi:outer membrane protein OmpU